MAGYIVALTGGIGSGKTAASDRFAELGVGVVDMDITSREVVEPGEPALARIADRFGPAMLDDAGMLDRRAMRAHIFEHPDERRWLERLLHPVIVARVIEQLEAATSAYAVVVNPLMRGKDHYVHRVLVIDVPESTQLERTMARDQLSQQAAQAILDAQIDRNGRLALADDVIVNDTDLATLHAHVDAMHTLYLGHAR